MEQDKHDTVQHNPPYNRGLFIFPYRTDPWAPYGKIPPIGLEIVAASVRDLFDRMDIIDMRFEKDVTPYLDGTDVVCISIPSGRAKGVASNMAKKYDMEYVFGLIENIPEDKTLILGGTYAAEMADFFLDRFPHIDFIVKGQGEETLRELLLNPKDADTKGVIYKKNGEKVDTGFRPPTIIPHLYPDRRLRKYKYHMFGNRIDAIYTSHGCPYTCTYCEFNRTRWNSRSAEDVFEELKSMDPETRYVLINDNNFMENTDRVIRILELLEKNHIKKSFWAQCRMAPLAKNKELVNTLSKTGFFLGIGVESAQDHVLEWLKKGYTQETNLKAFENLKRTSVIIQAYYIIGNYKETKEEILQIADYSHRNWIDFMCINRLRCYPNTRLARIIDGLDGIHVDEKSLRVYTDDISKKELTRLCKKITNAFYISRHLFRSFCKISLNFNIPFVVRYFLVSAASAIVFRRNREMVNLTDRLLRFNIFFPVDYVFNTLLRITGRLVYGIKR